MKLTIDGRDFFVEPTLGLFNKIKTRFGLNLLNPDLVDFGKFLANSQDCFEVCCGFLGLWEVDQQEVLAEVCKGSDVKMLIEAVRDSLVDFIRGRGDEATAAAVEKTYATMMAARADLAKRVRSTDLAKMVSKELDQLDLTTEISKRMKTLSDRAPKT